MRSATRAIASGLALALAYFVAAKLGLALAFENASASPVWPATGLAIASLVLMGPRFFPAIFLGAFFANLTTAGTILTSLGIGAGNTLEALAGALLIHHFLQGPGAFARGRDALVFAALCAPVAALSATVGVATLALGGLTSLDAAPSVWLTWWLGDYVGALAVTPFLLLWLQPRGPPRRILETWFSFAFVVLTGLVVFATTTEFHEPLVFLCLPPVVWTAMRLGRRATATATLVLSAIAVLATLLGRGPFAETAPNLSLLLLQSFIGVVCLVGLGLACVERERAKTAEALDHARRLLEARVEERTASLESAMLELRASEASLARSQSIAHVGSWEWDIPTNHVTWSRELYTIFGLDPEKFAADYGAYLAALPPEDAKFANDVVQRALDDHQPFEFEHRVLRPDGTARWVRGRGEVLCDAHGKPAKMIGTAQDITEEHTRRAQQREAEERERELERLRESQAFRARLLSAVSHELKTPITPLKLQLHMLKEGHLGPTTSKQARAIEVLDRNLARLEALVSQTLEIGRLQEGRIRVEHVPVDLSVLAQDISDTYAEVCARAGVLVVLDTPEECFVQGDPARLAQVVINLVSNALKFTPEGGTITISTRNREDVAELAVRDTGAGIPPNELSRLFQPFTQLDAGRAKGGSGLGLYISRGIVESHEGTLTAESAGEGSGTTFTLRLPRLDTPPPHSP